MRYLALVGLLAISACAGSAERIAAREKAQAEAQAAWEAANARY